MCTDENNDKDKTNLHPLAPPSPPTLLLQLQFS